MNSLRFFSFMRLIYFIWVSSICFLALSQNLFRQTFIIIEQMVLDFQAHIAHVMSEHFDSNIWGYYLFLSFFSLVLPICEYNIACNKSKASLPISLYIFVYEHQNLNTNWTWVHCQWELSHRNTTHRIHDEWNRVRVCVKGKLFPITKIIIRKNDSVLSRSCVNFCFFSIISHNNNREEKKTFR